MGGDERPGTGGVIVFDGVCRLCSGWVRFVAARDPAARFRFVAFQSAAARRPLARCGPGLDPSEGRDPTERIDPGERIDPAEGIVLVSGAGCLVRSDAALAIASGLAPPWPLVARGARLVPRALREAVYRLVARRRTRWFGAHDRCFVPDAALRARFLPEDPEDDDA